MKKPTPYQQIENILNYFNEMSLFTMRAKIEPNGSFSSIDFEKQNSDVDGFEFQYLRTDETEECSGTLAYQLSNKNWFVIDFLA